jgi:hypothetical protein
VTEYSLFGHCLSSELAFPELNPALPGNPRWWVRPRPAETPPPQANLIREATALPCTMRLHRTPDGYWLQHHCTGDYFISRDGSQIEYQPLPGATLDAVRFDILGRVMALALHAGGWLCLHGSGSRLARGAVGFFAPKGYGKSTLASALVRAGAGLASDDLLVIQPERPAMVLPGVPRLRLREDSYGSTSLDGCKAERGPDGKRVVTEIPDERRMLTPTPLLALYLLDPVKPRPGGAAVERELLSQSAAARTLVGYSKNAVILDQREAFDVLEHAYAVGRQVPVYRLGVSRDLGRIGEVAQQMIEWHDTDALQPSAAS